MVWSWYLLWHVNITEKVLDEFTGIVVTLQNIAVLQSLYDPY